MKTPVLRQYERIKNQYAGYFVFFRLGDFYELFYEQAIEAAPILGTVLTKRADVPMCGIPYMSLDNYLKKMIEAGKKVAICEQTNESLKPLEEFHIKADEEAKIMCRNVVYTVSAGTYIDSFKTENNFIASVFYLEKIRIWSLSYGDLSTGECFYVEFSNLEDLLVELEKIKALEIVICQEFLKKDLYIYNDKFTYYNINNENEKNAYEILLDFLKANGYEFEPNLIRREPIYAQHNRAALKNLEILEGGVKTLFSVLDRTQTAMGKRILKDYLSRPLNQLHMIEERLNRVEFFINLIISSGSIKINIADLNKLLNNLKTPSNLRKLAESIKEAESLMEIKLPIFFDINTITIHKKILSMIIETPGEIGSGLVLSNIKESQNIKQKLDKILLDIYSLPDLYKFGKIKQNDQLGFFIETKNPQKEDFLILRQGLASSYRYSTNKLMSLQFEYNECKYQLKKLEEEIFNELVQEVYSQKNKIEELAHHIGLIDYYHCAAELAVLNNYKRPKFTTEKKLKIIEGRHPVIEKLVTFIPNNLNLED